MIITYVATDLFARCIKSEFYSFIPLLFLCGCIGRCMLCLSLSNCSLNHSAMGFRYCCIYNIRRLWYACMVCIFTSPKKRGKRSRSKLRFLRHHTHNTVYIENTSRCKWFTGPVRTESICRLIYPNLPA